VRCHRRAAGLGRLVPGRPRGVVHDAAALRRRDYPRVGRARHPMGGGADRMGGADAVGVDGSPRVRAVRAGSGRAVRIPGGGPWDVRPLDARARAAAARTPLGAADRAHDLAPPSAGDGELGDAAHSVASAHAPSTGAYGKVLAMRSMTFALVVLLAVLGAG